MKTPFFSVVIPCYNVENSIEATLQSLQKQTFLDFEIVFVNDGSEDSTLAILNSYNSPVTKRIISQQNLGLGAARNTGIRESNGRYIAFLDGDDSWLPEKLSIIYEVLSKDERIELICHNEFIITETNQLLKKNYYGPYSKFDDLFFKANCLSPSAVTVNSEVFNKVGLFTENRKLHGVEDYDMWLRMSMNNINFHYIKEFLGNYIIHGNNMSTKFKFFETQERVMLMYGLKAKRGFKNYLKMRRRFLIFYLIKLKVSISTKEFSYMAFFFRDLFNLFFLPDFLTTKLSELDA